MLPPMYLEMATTPGYNDMGIEEPMVGMEGAKFGGKSSYFPVANTDDSPLEVEGCKPVMLWMYVRHGTRNPGDSDIAGMKTHSRRCIITEQAPTRACSFATFANTTPDPDPSNLASRKNLIK